MVSAVHHARRQACRTGLFLSSRQRAGLLVYTELLLLESLRFVSYVHRLLVPFWAPFSFHTFSRSPFLSSCSHSQRTVFCLFNFYAESCIAPHINAKRSQVANLSNHTLTEKYRTKRAKLFFSPAVSIGRSRCAFFFWRNASKVTKATACIVSQLLSPLVLLTLFSGFSCC